MNIAELNKQIAIASEDRSIPPGLLHGKMGLSIYFYQLARMENKEEWGKIAEHLLDEVFEQIGMVKSIDIENGLAGIGMGISYLIRNRYVQGNENEILREADDEIFKQISFTKQNSNNVVLLIQVLLYACTRMQCLCGEQRYLWGELAIQMVNTLHANVETILNDNAISFRLDSNLPLFLFALGKTYETGIYNYKIERIMREITPFIMSKYGYLDSKRLYLLWGIGQINKYIRDERLTEFCKLLASQINIDNLLGEFRDKNISIKKGLAGVCLLMLTLTKDIRQHLETKRFYIMAIEKMENSSIWRVFTDEMSPESSVGLSEYCWIITIYNAIKRRG